jgi:hypothetical protein
MYGYEILSIILLCLNCVTVLKTDAEKEDVLNLIAGSLNILRPRLVPEN